MDEWTSYGYVSPAQQRMAALRDSCQQAITKLVKPELDSSLSDLKVSVSYAAATDAIHLSVNERLRNIGASFLIDQMVADTQTGMEGFIRSASQSMVKAINQYDLNKFGGDQIIADNSGQEIDPETGATRYNASKPKFHRKSASGSLRGLSPEEADLYEAFLKGRKKNTYEVKADDFSWDSSEDLETLNALMHKERLVREAQEAKEARDKEERQRKAKEEEVRRLAAIEEAKRQREQFYTDQGDFGEF